MDYYSTDGPPEMIPGLVRVTDDGRWERWKYMSGRWERDMHTQSEVFYSGDWVPCSEQDLVDAIRHRPPDHPTSLTPEELASS